MAPGRPSYAAEPSGSERPLRTLLVSGSGKPPGGTPIAPWKYETTEAGSGSESADAITSSGSRFDETMNCARSPTTFDDGVTFGMSPRRRLACAYFLLISAHRSSRPSCFDWYSRLVYWPPGISWA